VKHDLNPENAIAPVEADDEMLDLGSEDANLLLDADLDEERKRHVDDLIDRIKESAEKLANDGPTRGDLKILSRAMRELRYAFKVFTPYRGDRKVTVFGSARTQPDQPAYEQAMRFGKAMAQQDWLVVTGAASGIMEAGHRGAGREHSMGLNIMLPFEQQSNPVIAGDPKLVYMKYFFTRKLMFVKECDAVVCLPGGYGTLDEAMEVLTLLQTGKRDIIPLVLLDAPGGNYWTALEQFMKDHLPDLNSLMRAMVRFPRDQLCNDFACIDAFEAIHIEWLRERAEFLNESSEMADLSGQFSQTRAQRSFQSVLVAAKGKPQLLHGGNDIVQRIADFFG
jgi:uncharacterized protein (TIGR00730 family)